MIFNHDTSSMDIRITSCAPDWEVTGRRSMIQNGVVKIRKESLLGNRFR